MMKAYATWFTNPNHDRTSVRFFGVGKSLIAQVNFLAWFDGISSDFEAREFHAGGCKLEFQWVQSAAKGEPITCLFYGVRPQKSVVDTLFLRDVRYDFIVSSGIAISRRYVALGGCFVPVAAPRGDECRVMTIVGVQGDAVVPIPGVEHGFQFAERGLVEWRLGVVSLPCCLGIEGLKIYCAPRCAIFSRADHHLMAPGMGTCSRTPRRTSLSRSAFTLRA